MAADCSGVTCRYQSPRGQTTTVGPVWQCTMQPVWATHTSARRPRSATVDLKAEKTASGPAAAQEKPGRSSGARAPAGTGVRNRRHRRQAAGGGAGRRNPSGLWPEGEELVRDGDSAIWLSRHAFTELAGTRRTAWDATAFDSLVFSALDSFADLLAAYRRMADRLSPEQQAALRELTADADGPLVVFSPLGAFKALLGFRVTEIQVP